MADTTELRSANSRRSFVLEIAGVPVRYYSGTAPTAKTVPNTAGVLSYADRPGIVNIGTISASYDVAGGVADFSPFSIDIAIRDPLDEYDPVNVLGRTGSKGATFASQVLSTVASSTAGGSMTIETDASGLTYPRLMCIGDEAIWATAAGAVAPYTLTYTVRGSAGTLPQRHVADTVTGDVPLLTSEACFFRGRRVVLYAHAERPTGGHGDLVEVMRGFIESAPSMTDDATVMTLSVQPITALLDQSVGSADAKAGLVHGWHYFSRERNDLMHVQSVDYDTDWYELEAISNAGSGYLNVRDPHVADHQEVFDAPTGASPKLAYGHPRSGKLWHTDLGAGPIQADAVAEVLGYDGGAGFTIDTALPAVNMDDGARLRVAPAAELLIHEIADTSGGATLQAWPQVVVEGINSSSGWAPGSHRTDTGQWCDVRINLDTQFGDYLEITPNVPKQVRVVFWMSSAGYDAMPELYRKAKNYETRQPAPNTAVAIPRGIDRSSQWSDFGLLIDPVAEEEGDFRVYDVQSGRGRAIVPMGGHALGFYTMGERYILADTDIPIGDAGYTTIRIEYSDPYTGERAESPVTTRVKASSAKTGPDGSTVGYLLELEADEYQNWRVPSFGDWSMRGNGFQSNNPGYLADFATEPVTIETVFEVNEADAPYDVLLRLLHSVNGKKVNGDYDVLPWGAGIPAAAIDSASFVGFPYPPELQGWSFRYPKGATVREVIDPMLRAFGAIITLRTDSTGACRLTMLPIGVESRVEAVQTIAAGDWIDSHQSWGVDDDVRNVFRFRYNFDDEGEPGDVVEIRDKRSIRNFSGEVREMDFDLYGLRETSRGRATITNTFRNIWSRFIATLGFPRRLWRGDVRTGDALFANLGAVYKVTSPWLKGYTTGLGVTGECGRLKSADIDLWNEGASLSFSHFGSRATGWNAAMSIVGVTTANTVTVAANAYTDTTNPHTGAAFLDVTLFHTNDVVLCVPFGAPDAYVQATITTIAHTAPHVVTVVGHGLHTTPGGYICPSTYSVSSATHTDLAYLASSTTSLLMTTQADDYA